MGFIKNIARSTLQNEIKELKENLGNVTCSFLQSQKEVFNLKEEKNYLEAAIKSLENENASLRAEMQEIEAKYKEQLKEESDERYRVTCEKADADRKVEALEKENVILMKYYSLDREATDDIKEKIRIDFEINRLEGENQRLRNLSFLIGGMQCMQQLYIPQPYSCYGYSGMLF